jgi:hypothetical protein
MASELLNGALLLIAFNGRSSGAVNGTAAYRSQPGRGYNPGLVSNGTYPGPGHTAHLSLGNTQQIYDMMMPSHENPSVARVQQQHNVFRATHPAFLFGPNSSQGGCCSTQRRFASVPARSRKRRKIPSAEFGRIRGLRFRR